MIDLGAPIDASDPALLPELDKIQGNILKGHGRNHTAHLFIVLPADAGQSRAWLARLAQAQIITSASQQLAQSAHYRLTGGMGEPFACVALSAHGFSALEVAPELHPDDPYFSKGMKQHNAVGVDTINDPPPGSWAPGYQKELDAMLLLADDDAARLDESVDKALKALAGIGADVFVEPGDKLTASFGPSRPRVEIEHFGFQDGISNPQMLVADVQKERSERGREHWDPVAPAGLVIVAEKGGREDRFGSYLVFRKLEQDVAGFKAALVELSIAAGISGDDAGALVVGRHRDGTPLMPATVAAAGADANDFNFSGDRPAAGLPALTCPFHAHIRRTNPRGDLPFYGGPSLEFERSMRIARRAITYGKRPDLAVDGPPPSVGVGLLFMCHQASIRQFAIQQAGSDSKDFPFPGAGLEGLTGRAAPGLAVEPQLWPTPTATDPASISKHLMMRFVTLLGGEYLFAPSIPFLASLARDEAGPTD